LNSKDIDTVIISDISGKIIQKISSENKTRIEVSSLPVGIYIFSFLTKSEVTEIQKIIVK